MTASENVSLFALCEDCLARQGGEASAQLVGGRSDDCFICRGLTSRKALLTRTALRAIKNYDFQTFTVGLILPPGVQEREDHVRSELKIRGKESVKMQFSRGIGEAVVAATGRSIDKLHPDLAILLNLRDGSIELASKPLFLYGRYTKPRDVSQKIVFCESCGGRGCGDCDGTGYESGPSVESVVTTKLGKVLGSSRMKFTWVGSEDRDSLVKAPGRPFVVEVKSPVRRRSKKAFSMRTGRGLVKVSGLKALPGRPLRIPSFRVQTEVTMEAEGKVGEEELRRFARGMKKGVMVGFRNNKGKMVDKAVQLVSVRGRGRRVVARVKIDGGLPVKRFVSGESVSPSASELLGTPLSCLRFDILKVWETGDFQFG